ncbi:MAG: beta-ketoacyl-ACP synthase II [Planctomycetes bacterium]|nr:beta-ketoacyl-ACP synthase II [Planctomycetota bacterium]
MSYRRVVITGMGAVTPFGVTVDAYWDALVEGRSGIGPVTLFDTSQYTVRIGGECAGFRVADHIDRKTIKRLDRFSQLALVSADEAIRDSGLDLSKEDRRRIAVVHGSGIGGLSTLEEQHGRLETKGPSKVSAFTIPRLMVNAAAGNISIAHGLQGPSIAVSSACASATNAMGEALSYIRTNVADVVVTGGSEAALTPLALAAFASMKALSTRNDDPTHACRPFDRNRDGFLLGEGAGTLIFEELDHAKRRKATIMGEVIGFASTSDADHITQPMADGKGAAAAMRLALEDAGIAPSDVDYINAHGTSTPIGDLAETRAIKQVFGDHAGKLIISSTKSCAGHSLGASGGMELIATIRAIANSVVPPTMNLDDPDDGCDLDYCPNVAQDRSIGVALSNSFGFGGHNACILVRRFE